MSEDMKRRARLANQGQTVSRHGGTGRFQRAAIRAEAEKAEGWQWKETTSGQGQMDQAEVRRSHVHGKIRDFITEGHRRFDTTHPSHQV